MGQLPETHQVPENQTRTLVEEVESEPVCVGPSSRPAVSWVWRLF